MNPRLNLAVCSALLALAGCGGGSESSAPTSNDPFPLAVGNRWEFSFSDSRAGSPEARTYEVVGTQEIDGKIAHIVRDTLVLARDSPYLRTDTEVLHYAGSDVPPDQQADWPQTILRLPLHVGDRWTQIDKVSDAGYDADEDGVNEVRSQHAEVEVVRTEAVVTPAGTFANAFVVYSSDAAEELNTVTHVVYNSYFSGTTEWYVPGIGVVRRDQYIVPWGAIRTYGSSEVLTAYRVTP